MRLDRLRLAVGTDIRSALRQIARTPLFSGVVIAVIALGIGINAGLLTTLNTYAWQPAPGIPRGENLVRLSPRAAREKDARIVDVNLSAAELRRLAEQRDVFADVAGWNARTLGVDFGAGAETVAGFYTTSNFFRALRVSLSAGAGFPDVSDRSSEPIVVIGHSLWLAHFGGSPDAIGKTIRVMNVPFRIVGVAPPRFVGVDVKKLGSSAIWIPLGAQALLEPDVASKLSRPDAMTLVGVARLADDVSPGDVEARTRALAFKLGGESAKPHRQLTVRATPLTGLVAGESATVELMIAFFIVVALIVVITCTNVSALLLGRAVARRREIGIRLALGATRLRVIRQMLTESLVQAMAGALLGLLLYTVVMKIAYLTVPGIIEGMQTEMATFGFAAIFAVVTTILFGLAPALHATRTDIGEVLKNSGSSSIRRSRLQAALIVVQLACSQPVLVVTALVLSNVRAGVNDASDAALSSIMTMEAEFLRPSDSASAATHERLDRIRRRLVEVEGVQSIAIWQKGHKDSFREAGKNAGATQFRQVQVTADYFSTLGIAITSGRAIGADDDHSGSRVVIISDSAAARLWPKQNAIGKQLVRRSFDDVETTLEVIGVARVPVGEDEDDTPRVFVPLSTSESLGESRISVRTAGDARAFVPRLRAGMREVDQYATVGNVTTLAEWYESQRLEAVQSNLAAFAVAAAALLLASLGLYAIIAFAVAQRTREIGVRMSLGATPSGVVRQFFRHGVRLSAIGLAIGIPVTVVGIRLVQASVVGFSLRNVAAVLAVIPVLLGIAALASWLPARRAGSVDPLVALRAE